MKTNSWTTAGQTKDISSSPNPLVKILRRGRHWVWGSNRRRAIEEWSIAINNDWVDNLACSLPHNIQAIANSFITVNYFSELLRKVRFSHKFSKSVHLVTVKFCFRYTLLQKCFQTDTIFFYQGIVSAIKFRKRPAKFKQTIALPKKFGSKCFTLLLIDTKYTKPCVFRLKS